MYFVYYTFLYILVQDLARTGFSETYLEKLNKDKLKQKKKEKAKLLKEKKTPPVS